MDSTGPDPQQQSQQMQPPPPQQQPPQQQQPKPQPHQHQHPPHPTAQPNAYPPIPTYTHGPFFRASYGPPSHQYPFPYTYPTYQPPLYQPANFSPAQAQPLSNMVNQQPQSNVPQQHNKPSSQIINTTISAADRSHHQSLQTVTITNQAAPVIRERRKPNPATLKDPATKQEVPLPNTTTSTTKSSPSTTKPSPNALTTTTTTTSVCQTLLQKVSEDTIGEEKKIEQPQPQQPLQQQQPQQQQQQQQQQPQGEEEGEELEVVDSEEVKDKEVEEKVNGSKEDTIVEEEQTKEPHQQQPQQQVVEEVKAEEEEEEVKEKEVNEVNDKEDEVDSKEEKDKEEGEKVNGNEDGNDSNKDEQESNPGEALNYEPGQYNPFSNRKGKKIYSRQFLLDVCKIYKLDQQKESDKTNDESNQTQIGQFDPFMPAFSNSQRFAPNNRQNEPARRQSQHNYAGRSSAGQERQRKVITSVSLTQEVELKTTSNPWRPTKEIKEDAPAPNDEVETESLKKKFRSILNKLTPNNFENLARAVTDLNIDTESKLGEVIDIVFAKALAEPGYCVLYGRMCSHLKKITAGAANFGNTLLKRCQHQFQSDIYSGLDLNERKLKIDNEEESDVKKQLNEELYEEMYRCRMRSLGLIKFIGELYKIEMLNDSIMFDCVHRLLGDTSEESLECLCDLLATIGEKLDNSSKKSAAEKEKRAPKSAPKANAYQGGQKSAAAVVASGSTASQQQKAAELQNSVTTSLDPVFEQFHKIRKNKDLPLSLRIRFKLLDTCDLREKDHWKSKKTKDNNPKKIEEIREAHKEKLEQERRQQNAMGPRRNQDGRRGLGNSGSSNQISLMNESSGNRGSLGMHTSSSSGLLRDSIGDNMKSNQNEIGNYMRHMEFMKGLVNKGNLTSKTSSSDTLRPTTQLRPAGGLYNQCKSSTPPAASIGATTTASGSTSSTETSSTTATGASNPVPNLTSVNKEDEADRPRLS